jgi:hypothetical protein
VTDLEHTLGSRLHRLADDLAPDADPFDQAGAARSRYRRQRRTRAGMTALAAATAAIVIGVPAALGAIASAPDPGGVAGPAGATRTAPSTATGTTTAEQDAARQAAEVAQQAADGAELAAAAAAAGLGRPLVLPAPTASARCPDAAAELSRALGLPLQHWQGEHLAGEAPCEWGVGAQAATPIVDRFTVGARFLPGTSSAQLSVAARTTGPGACSTAGAPAVAPAAVVRRCLADEEVQWSLEVPDPAGTGLWEFRATVGVDVTTVSGPAGLAALADLPPASWGG